MNILFTRFPLESIPRGGAERQVMSLATGLAERGHAVSFAGDCGALGPAFREAHLPVIDLDIGPPPVSKAAVARFALRKGAMKQRLETMLAGFRKLDVLVMLSLSEKLLLTDIAAERGIRVVWIEHDPVGRWLTKNPWLKLLKKQSEFATTVTVSELSRVQYLEMDWNPKKTISIPNGIADSWFQDKVMSYELRAKRNVQSPLLHLGCVARLAEEKGVDVLLRAIAEVPHTTLDIVGTGPEETALKKQAHRLGLDHRVRFLGSTDDMAHVYRVIDALALPSRTIDPFGMVVAEAMATGVPCLVTDACGIASCLQAARDVLVVQRDNVRSLAKGIRELHGAEKRRLLAENGRRAAKQHFAVSTMVDRYETLFTGNSPR